MPRNQTILETYFALLQEYGPQGWWPVQSEGNGEGYHPGSYHEPQTRLGRFEIGVGAVLTQNTAWTNVRRALDQLRNSDVFSPESIQASDQSRLQNLIRPAGYFRQKAQYLFHLATWFLENDASLVSMSLEAARASLLSVKGVGPETADSILLYAYRFPLFVVDAYTRRIFAENKVFNAKGSYHTIQQAFHDALPRDVNLYQEYHALIVAHAKKTSRVGHR